MEFSIFTTGSRELRVCRHFRSRSEVGVVMAALAMDDSASEKDAIAEGLLDLLKPSVQQLDLHVHSMR